MDYLTANQLAVLTAYHRGYKPALEAESKRANFDGDVHRLLVLGFLKDVGAPLFNVTEAGQAFLRRAQGDNGR